MVTRKKVKQPSKTQLVAEAYDLMWQIEQTKPLRERLSEIAEELFEMGFTAQKLKGVGKQLILNDNFAEKNTVFRSVGVSRFELKLIDDK